jgi:hypothetical protein
MNIGTFLAVVALIVSIIGLVRGAVAWPWASNVATLILAIAFIIITMGGGHISL